MGDVLLSFMRRIWPQLLAAAFMAAPAYFDISHNVAAHIWWVCGGLGLFGLFTEVRAEITSSKTGHSTRIRVSSWVGIIFGTIILIIIGWYFWPNHRVSSEEKPIVSDPLDLTVLVSCEPSGLPEVFPTGVLYTTAFDYTGESDQRAPLSYQSGTAGTRIEWLPEQQHLGAKCQVSNQGADAIFHFEAEFLVSIHVSMQKAGHPEQGISAGPMIRSNVWKLQLEQIGGRSQETVYIWNGGPNIVEITLPGKARAQRLGQPATT
jgi:hypothetical protein